MFERPINSQLKSFTPDNQDYHQQAIDVFKRLENLNASNEEQTLLLFIKRLEYLKSHSNMARKDELYLEKLEEIVRIKKESDATDLAYINIIEFYLRKGDAESNQILNEERSHYRRAFKWIQKFQQNRKGSQYSNIVNAQRDRLLTKQLEVQTEGVNVSQENMLGYVKYRNIDKVYLRLYKLSEKEYFDYDNERRRENKLKFLQGRKIQKSWSLDLPASEDFNFHAAEFLIEALPYGRYILLSSDGDRPDISKNQIQLTSFVVSDLSYFNFTNKGEVLRACGGS